MRVFRLKGTFHMRPTDQPFRLEVVADDEAATREYAYSVLGSRHRARRDQVHIWRITEISADEVTDPTVADVLEAGAAGGTDGAPVAGEAQAPAPARAGETEEE